MITFASTPGSVQPRERLPGAGQPSTNTAIFYENLPINPPFTKSGAFPLDQIRSNAYNPNSVAPPEMKLLYQSIKEDGYTMPIVCYVEDGTYEIVDGFHRCQIMKTYRDIYEREGWHDAGGRNRQASWKPHGFHHQAQPCPIFIISPS